MNHQLKSELLRLRTEAVVNDGRKISEALIRKEEDLSRKIREKWLGEIHNLLKTRASRMAQETSGEAESIFD